MYSTVTLGTKYLHYLLTASNGRGHGVHSPFVFNFITKVLNDSTNYKAYIKVEAIRNELRRSNEILAVEDFGAGSATMKSNNRRIADIAKSSLKPKKFSQLLYRLVQYYKPATIVELGTSLGITASYLALANNNGRVYTFEGSDAIAELAHQTFNKAGATNLEIVRGNFDKTLGGKIADLATVDLAFVDGNHRKSPTLQYFAALLEKANEHSIFIFDDIHWSSGMEEAWKEIQQHPSVTLTVDLFFIGLVFFRKEQKSVQHFIIRF